MPFSSTTRPQIDHVLRTHAHREVARRPFRGKIWQRFYVKEIDRRKELSETITSFQPHQRLSSRLISQRSSLLKSLMMSKYERPHQEGHSTMVSLFNMLLKINYEAIE